MADAAVTPIPPALLMFLTGLTGLGGLTMWRRRRTGATSAVAS
jgi:MYXO-CTERM domain-containing protein